MYMKDSTLKLACFVKRPALKIPNTYKSLICVITCNTCKSKIFYKTICNTSCIQISPELPTFIIARGIAASFIKKLYTCTCSIYSTPDVNQDLRWLWDTFML